MTFISQSRDFETFLGEEVLHVDSALLDDQVNKFKYIFTCSASY